MLNHNVGEPRRRSDKREHGGFGLHCSVRPGGRSEVGRRSSASPRGGRMSHADAVDEVLAGPQRRSPNGPVALTKETSEPVFTAEFDSYRMEWSAPPVTIRLEDVRGDRRSGDVKADVDVAAGGIRILENVSINMKASTTRAQLAKQLTELSKGVAPASFWATAINDTCGRAVRAFRDGDPPVLLRDAQPPAVASGASRPLVLADHRPGDSLRRQKQDEELPRAGTRPDSSHRDPAPWSQAGRPDAGRIR